MNEDTSTSFATELKDSETGNVNGLSLNFIGGAAPCVSNPTKQYKLTVNLYCNEDYQTAHFKSDNDDSCEVVLDYESK